MSNGDTICLPMKKKDSGYEIRVGYVTPFIVKDLADNHIVAAFDTLREAMDHFPTAEVTEGAWRKAKELGQK
jgi:hypothetical protein